MLNNLAEVKRKRVDAIVGFRSFVSRVNPFPAQSALSFHPRNPSPTPITIKTWNEHVLKKKPTEKKDHVRNS